MEKIITAPEGGDKGDPALADQFPGTEPSSVTVCLDDEVLHVLPEQILDLDFVKGFRARCGQAKSPIAFGLSKILDWKDPARFTLLDVVASLPNSNLNADHYTGHDLLEAVLALSQKDLPVEQARRAKFAALEVAVLRFPDALEIACGRIRDRLKAVGVSIRLSSLVKEAKEILKGLSQPAPTGGSDLVPVKTVLPDAPCGAEVVVPGRWTLSPEGVQSVAETCRELIRAPLIITERGTEVQRGRETLSVAWRRAGKWLTRPVPRGDLADRRRIIELADHGFPVNSSNADAVVRYLSDFEADNFDRLPLVKVSSRLGWQGVDGEDGFLLGRRLLTAAAPTGGAAAVKETTAQPRIQFRGVDHGDDQLADGYTSAGTFDRWRQAVGFVKDYPRAKLVLYGAFVPVMQGVLRTPNFVIDVSGATTTGKSTTLRVAASVWGRLDDGGTGPAAMATWNSTETWRERAASLISHLPLILDESKHVSNPDQVAKTIYLVAGGRGKGRGTVRGIAEQGFCQTVLISSGEQPATSFTNDGGTRSRVLSLWGPPFGQPSQQTGLKIRKMLRRLSSNYGHAAEKFIEFMLADRALWKQARKEYAQAVRDYQNLAGDNAVAGRMADHFAAVRVTSRLVHQALDLPWDWADPIEPLWDELTQEAAGADQAAAALQTVLSWAAAHSRDFYRPDKEGLPPGDGWAGRWESAGIVCDEEEQHEVCAWLGFMPHLLDQLLRERRYDPHSIVRLWKDRGWLKTDAESGGVSRNGYRTNVGARKVRVIAITGEAMKGVMGL